MSSPGVGGFPALVIIGVAGLSLPLAVWYWWWSARIDNWSAIRRTGGLGMLVLALSIAILGVTAGLPTAVTAVTLTVAVIPLLWLAPLTIGWALTGALVESSSSRRTRAVVLSIPLTLIPAILIGLARRQAPATPTGGSNALITVLMWTALVLFGPGLVAFILLWIDSNDAV